MDPQRNEGRGRGGRGGHGDGLGRRVGGGAGGDKQSRMKLEPL